MMNQPLVSIIIPSYNRGHLIGETLDSVLAQTYQNWECIIVDDGSTDNTVEVVELYLRKDNRFQYHHRPATHKPGGNGARNYGFKISKGQYILFFDSDDLLSPLCLSERVVIMLSNLKVELLIRDTSYYVNGFKKQYSINRDPNIICKNEYLRMFFSHQIPWPIMGAFYKRSLLLNIRFDENLKRFQDISFNIKVLANLKTNSILRNYKIDSYYSGYANLAITES